MLIARRRATPAGLESAVGEVAAKLARAATTTKVNNCMSPIDSISAIEFWGGPLISIPVQGAGLTMDGESGRESKGFLYTS